MEQTESRESKGAGPTGAASPRRFREHLIPRTRSGRRLALLFIGLFLLAEWPILPLADRIEPTVLGFPFLFVYLFVVYAALIATLVVAAWRGL